MFWPQQSDARVQLPAALQFLIFTAARRGEATGATWAEMDSAVNIWTIPAARMKSGRSHRVQLSNTALAVLKTYPQKTDYCFPGIKPGQPISGKTFSDLLEGTGATVHGMRSSFRDWAGNETSYPREIIEQCLAHVVGGKTEQAYRRQDALERRRELMEAWADFCAPKSAKVISLRGSRK